MVGVEGVVRADGDFEVGVFMARGPPVYGRRAHFVRTQWGMV